MRMFRVWALVSAGATTLVGCGAAEASMCRQSSEAEFCLVEDGQAYKSTGHGFRPGSEVHFMLDDAPQPVDAAHEQMSGLRIDEAGRVPAQGGATGVLRGKEPQRVTVTGTATSGEEVSFEFTVPPAGR